MRLFSIFILFWMILLFACSSTSIQKENTSHSSPLPSFQLRAENKIHELKGIPLRLEDTNSVKILVPDECYVYVYMQKEGKIVSASYYDQTPGAGTETKSIAVDLQNIEVQNADWFLVKSKEKISEENKESLRSFFASIQRPSPSTNIIVYPKPSQWRILSLDWQEGVATSADSVHVLGTIEILRAPFSIQIFAQKKGETEYRPFDSNKESLKLGDKCKFRIDTYRDINIAFFLREKSHDRQLYPYKKDTTVSVKPNTTLNFPIEKELDILDESGSKYLCCFCSDKSISCKDLQRWLRHSDTSQVEIVLSRGTRGPVTGAPPAPLYTVALSEK